MSDQISKRVYIVSVLTAASLGVGGTLVAGGVPEVQAGPLKKRANVHVTLGPAAHDTFENFIEARLCPQTLTEFGENFGCAAALFCEQGIDFKCVPTEDPEAVPPYEWVGGSNVSADGYWTEGEPE